jgi:uncharacterized membrane protein
MGDDNVQQIWYGLYLIKAVVALFVVSVVVLLCVRVLRYILCDRIKRRSAKHPMVHSLGTVQPTRRAADLDPSRH